MLRQHREDLRKRELAEALAVETRLKQEALRLARLRQHQADEFRTRQQAGPLDMRAIIDCRAFIGLLDRRILEGLQDVAKAEHATAGHRQNLVQAMKDRKAIEVLQQRAMNREQLAQARRETAELDDISTRRFFLVAGRT